MVKHRLWLQRPFTCPATRPHVRSQLDVAGFRLSADKLLHGEFRLVAPKLVRLVQPQRPGRGLAVSQLGHRTQPREECGISSGRVVRRPRATSNNGVMTPANARPSRTSRGWTWWTKRSSPSRRAGATVGGPSRSPATRNSPAPVLPAAHRSSSSSCDPTNFTRSFSRHRRRFLLTLTAPKGDIHWTDPRLPGGALDDTANRYSNAVSHRRHDAGPRGGFKTNGARLPRRCSSSRAPSTR